MKTALKILLPLGVMAGCFCLAVNMKDMTIFDGFCILTGFVGGCVSLVREVHEALDI